MAQNEEQNKGASAGSANDFEALFEESLRTVKPGGVVKGRVVGITSTHVLIDVGYKSEGQIPLQEFTDRHGNLQVKVGDDVDVYFESSLDLADNMPFNALALVVGLFDLLPDFHVFGALAR